MLVMSHPGWSEKKTWCFHERHHEGMVPDLFHEGQGVVVEGVWQPGEDFQASTILAKHAEDYVPVEMTAEGIAKAQKSMLQSLQ